MAHQKETPIPVEGVPMEVKQVQVEGGQAGAASLTAGVRTTTINFSPIWSNNACCNKWSCTSGRGDDEGEGAPRKEDNIAAILQAVPMDRVQTRVEGEVPAARDEDARLSRTTVVVNYSPICSNNTCCILQ